MNRKILFILIGVVMLISSMGMAFAEESAGANFADMPDNWSTDALQKAVSNGLLGGYVEAGKQLIKADSSLTRAEMATIVNRAFAAEKKGEIGSVSDVSSGAWHAGEMAKAVKMGTFMLDTKMRPNDGITRQEAFTVLARAFKLVGEGELKALDRFSDRGDIASWALASLAGMTAEGYIQGSDGKLQPQANITRAEFATVMNNLVKQYIDSAEEVNEVADGNVIIRVPGVTLKDVTVKGDLIIADGVGDGDVTLDNVTVQGRTVVRGGGVDSIIIKGNSDVGKVIVAKVDGEIRIYVEGGAEVEIIYVDDGSDDVIVEGTIGELEVAGESVTVYARDADIGGATVSGDNSKIVVGDGSKVKNGNITGASSAIVVDEGGSVDKVAVSGSGASVEGEGEVKEVEVKEGGDGASITTPKTKTVVDQGVEGVEAGGTPVEGGQTATNNDTGTGATVGDTPPPSGGTSRPRVSTITMITNPDDVTALANDAEVTVTLVTATSGAEIRYTINGDTPTASSTLYENPFQITAGYTGAVIKTIKVLATKGGHTDWTGQFTIMFMANEISVSQLVKKYYAAGETLSFTISGIRPNEEVRVGMPIQIGYDHPKFTAWASDQVVLTEGMEVRKDSGDSGRYWFGKTNELGELEVSGEVGAGLPYGPLCITLPDYETDDGHPINIEHAIMLGTDIGASVIVDGITAVGQTLTATYQIPTGATGISFKWMKANIEDGCYAVIESEENSTYKLGDDDAGKWIKVEVTGTKDAKTIQASAVVGPIVTQEQGDAIAAINPGWSLDKIEVADTGDLPEGVSNVDYKITIKTSYDTKESAQESGRTATTYFTIPEDFIGTIWYPVWDNSNGFTYKSATSGAVAYGMEGHPLCENNIDADGEVYVSLGKDVTDAWFGFDIKLVDGEEGWTHLVYGETTLWISPNDLLAADLGGAIFNEEYNELTLTKDVTVNRTITIPASVTLKTNGHSISGNGTIKVYGTVYASAFDDVAQFLIDKGTAEFHAGSTLQVYDSTNNRIDTFIGEETMRVGKGHVTIGIHMYTGTEAGFQLTIPHGSEATIRGHHMDGDEDGYRIAKKDLYLVEGVLFIDSRTEVSGKLDANNGLIHVTFDGEIYIFEAGGGKGQFVSKNVTGNEDAKVINQSAAESTLDGRTMKEGETYLWKGEAGRWTGDYGEAD
jgi:hypothetical protein